jgi:hypothetical protein
MVRLQPRSFTIVVGAALINIHPTLNEKTLGIEVILCSCRAKTEIVHCPLLGATDIKSALIQVRYRSRNGHRLNASAVYSAGRSQF